MNDAVEEICKKFECGTLSNTSGNSLNNTACTDAAPRCLREITMQTRTPLPRAGCGKSAHSVRCRGTNALGDSLNALPRPSLGTLCRRTVVQATCNTPPCLHVDGFRSSNPHFFSCSVPPPCADPPRLTAAPSLSGSTKLVPPPKGRYTRSAPLMFWVCKYSM